MIEDLHDLAGAALEAQLVYLLGSAVPWAAMMVLEGTAKLQVGRIGDVEYLGNMKSILGELDGIHAPVEVGLDKFLVKHVHSVLHDERCTDLTSLTKFDAIEARLRGGTLQPNVTMQGDMVIDGNKTAAAYHQIHKDDKSVMLPV